MKKKLKVVLAGNANVGKSVVFNQLTGFHQHIGNWPGKTIEKAEGKLFFKNYEIEIIDLPGIYSFSTFSEEEIVSREFIITEKPDVIINIIDAANLERNLFFTLQLLELGIPTVVGLNQIDVAKKNGIKINYKKISKILGAPVVPMVATEGKGTYKLIEKTIEAYRKKEKPATIKFENRIECKISKLKEQLSGKKLSDFPRWTAIRLIENDKKIVRETKDRKILQKATAYRKELEKIFHKKIGQIFAMERYKLVAEIIKKVLKKGKTAISLEEKLDELTTHPVLGYIIMALVIGIILYTIFKLGDLFSGYLEEFLSGANMLISHWVKNVWLREIISSAYEGIVAALVIVLPYIAPFYILLALLEDSGYLARIAFLTDNIMHKLGIHGKAFIPMFLGYGCNVPAVLASRIMETEREKTITAFLSTLVPCAARTVIILGLVGKFVGIKWAFALYALDLVIIFLIGKTVNFILPGKPVGLIMEMPRYHIPQIKIALKQAWFRIKEFIYIAFPVIIAVTVLIRIMQILGWLRVMSELIGPITVGWLHLPTITGTLLIFGILRKELILVMLASIFNTTNFSLVLSSVQMMVFAIVSMLYIPCVATIAALIKELGVKKAIVISVFEIAFAIFVGGIAAMILPIIL